MTDRTLVVRTMEIGDVDQVVNIHRKCFSDHVSLFSALGPKLAWHLYAQYVEELESVGKVLVDPESGRVAGFAAGTLEPGFHKRFLWSHFFLVCWHVLRGLFTQPSVWKMTARAVFVKDPFNAYKKNPLRYEGTPPGGQVGYFMPIAIDPDYRGGGNAVRLASALMEQFYAWGVSRIRGNKIAIENIPSQKLFVERLGWKSFIIQGKCVIVWSERQATVNRIGQDDVDTDSISPSLSEELYLYRAMRLGDLPAIAEIHRVCFPMSISIYSVLPSEVVQRFFKQFVLEPYSIAAVCEEKDTGRICGYATGTMKTGITGRFLRANRYLFAVEVLKKLFTHRTVARVLWANLSERQKDHVDYAKIEGGLPKGPVGNYRAIAVHPDFRGRKISEKLVVYVTDWLYAQGAVRVRGNGIRPDNIPSIKLFKKLGWHVQQVSEAWSLHWIDSPSDNHLEPSHSINGTQY